jgi:hypothetical protein
VDEKEFTTLATRLEQIAKVLEKLPAEIRSDAFDLLKPYATEHSLESTTNKKRARTKHEAADGTEEAFFGAFVHAKPAANAKLIAAYFYREYGVEPFSLDEVREKADAVGITVPARLDMTFLGAQEQGKKLFARAGLGKFRPTVSGEAHFKSTYSVKKGTKKRTGVDK